MSLRWEVYLNILCQVADLTKQTQLLQTLFSKGIQLLHRAYSQTLNLVICIERISIYSEFNPLMVFYCNYVCELLPAKQETWQEKKLMLHILYKEIERKKKSKQQLRILVWWLNGTFFPKQEKLVSNWCVRIYHTLYNSCAILWFLRNRQEV